MPALISILGLLKNPWVLLVLACGIGIGGTGYYRMRWLGEITGRQEAVMAAQKKADDLANELIIAQAAAMAVTEKKVVAYVDRIRTVQAPDTACAADERMRLGSHGVRDILGVPDAKRGAPAAVQGP